MAADGAILEARAVSAWRGERQVLTDVSLVVGRGQFLQVLGPNGSGKSTLLRILCGLLPPDGGSVSWRSAAISTTSERFLSELAYVGHLNALKPDLTALENLSYALGFRVHVTPAACLAALTRVGLDAQSHLPVRVLSAGQKRRLTLARLALDPAVLWILDEPATNLDAEGFALVEQLLREHLARGGIAIAAAHQRLLANDRCMSALELHG
jgi:heme exporter protein A